MANNHPDDKTPEDDQITDQNRKRVLTATSLGIIFAIAAALVFSLQDGISKYMATQYNVFFVVMLRYWAFAAFVLVMSSRGEGGIAAVARSQVMGLQFFRGMLLADGSQPPLEAVGGDGAAVDDDQVVLPARHFTDRLALRNVEAAAQRDDVRAAH